MHHYLFIDESGDPSLASINEDFPVFVLFGVLFTDEAYQKMSRDVISLKEEMFGASGVILHGREIRKCEGVFSKLFDLDFKEDFYKKINMLIGSSDFIAVAAVIDKQAFVNQYGRLADDPYELSLTFLLERMLMETDNNTEAKISVIIESRGKKEDDILRRRYEELLGKGSGFILPERFCARFSKTPDFRKKRENDIGLQIADLCAYPVARHFIRPDEPYPPYDIVESKLRKGKEGCCNGYGLKRFP